MSDSPINDLIKQYKSERQILLTYVDSLRSVVENIRTYDISNSDATSAIIERLSACMEMLLEAIGASDAHLSDIAQSAQGARDAIESAMKSDIINNVKMTDLIYKYKPELDEIGANEQINYDVAIEAMRATRAECSAMIEISIESILDDIHSDIGLLTNEYLEFISIADKSNFGFMKKEADIIRNELLRLESRHGRDALISVMNEIFNSTKINTVVSQTRLPTDEEINHIIAQGYSKPWRYRKERRGVKYAALDFFRETYAEWLDKGIQIPSHIMRRADRDLYQRLYSQVGNSAFAPK